MTYTHGFKDLTTDNWIEPDEIMLSFVQTQATEDVSPVRPSVWAGAILSVRVPPSVPEAVRGLFAVARGAMLYGYFFYPMYALATEQLFRVAEAALTIRGSELGCPRGKRFVGRVDWLLKRGVLTKDEAAQSHATRGLRNGASHPTEQTILLPGQALNALKATARMVSSLFS